MQYDGAILEKYAGKLMSQANSIELVYGIFGVVLAILIYWLGQSFMPENATVVVAIAVCAYYWYAGTEKSFMLKVEAQKAFVLFELEKRLRPT